MSRNCGKVPLQILREHCMKAGRGWKVQQILEKKIAFPPQKKHIQIKHQKKLPQKNHSQQPSTHKKKTSKTNNRNYHQKSSKFANLKKSSPNLRGGISMGPWHLNRVDSMKAPPGAVHKPEKLLEKPCKTHQKSTIPVYIPGNILKRVDFSCNGWCWCWTLQKRILEDMKWHEVPWMSENVIMNSNDAWKMKGVSQFRIDAVSDHMKIHSWSDIQLKTLWFDWHFGTGTHVYLHYIWYIDKVKRPNRKRNKPNWNPYLV